MKYIVGFLIMLALLGAYFYFMVPYQIKVLNVDKANGIITFKWAGKKYDWAYKSGTGVADSLLGHSMSTVVSGKIAHIKVSKSGKIVRDEIVNI